MKFVKVVQAGESCGLQLAQCAPPVAGVGEVLINVSASGVNRPDVLQRKGLYPAPAGASDILGLEVAGVIASGDLQAMQAANLSVGDRVCALVAGGGYAQKCVAPIAQCLPVPAGLSDVEAASLPETLFTAWSNLIDRGQLVRGETVLIQGGSSGIGVIALQLAKMRGARVLVTAGSDEKCAACISLGADDAINYKTQDFQLELMRLTNDQGVDVILDMVAGSYVAKEVESLREDGRLVLIAVQGGVHSEFDASLVLRRRLIITGSTLRARSVAFKSVIVQACWKHVWPHLASGQIKPVIFKVFDAAKAAQAHDLMESNLHIGKIVLNWGNT